MKEHHPEIRKPTPQLSLWGAEPPQQDAVLSEVLKELSLIRAEREQLVALIASGNGSSNTEKAVKSPEQADSDAELTIAHQLLFEGLNWRIRTVDGQEHQIVNTVGLRHIAVLLKSPNRRFAPMELARLNGRQCKRLGQASTRLASDPQSASQEELSVRNSLDRNEAVIDQECDERLRSEFKRLRTQLDDAYELQDTEAINRLEPPMLFLMKQFRQDHDVNGKIRLFDKREWERSRGSVTNALTRTLKVIRRKSSEIAEQINSQIDRRSGFAYRPLEGLPAWKVVDE